MLLEKIFLSKSFIIKKFPIIPSKVPEDDDEEEQKLFGLRIFF